MNYGMQINYSLQAKVHYVHVSDSLNLSFKLNGVFLSLPLANFGLKTFNLRNC